MKGEKLPKACGTNMTHLERYNRGYLREGEGFQRTGVSISSGRKCGMNRTGDSVSGTVGMNQRWRKEWLAKLKHNYYLSEIKIRNISYPGIYYSASGVS